MIQLSALRDREVLNTSSATTVGQVDGVIIDPASHTVTALTIRGTIDDATIVPWTDLEIGPDLVTVTTRGAVHAPRNHRERRAVDKELTVVAKRVLTDSGVEIGVVHDVSVEETSGAIVEIHLGGRHIAGADLVGIGGYAVVVRGRSDFDPGTGPGEA